MRASKRTEDPSQKRSPQTAFFAALVLSVGSIAGAADPSDGSGAAMLEALRSRDAAQRWAAAAEALPAPPQTLPPVVDPVFVPPRMQDAGVDSTWQSSSSRPGRATIESPPAMSRIATQDRSPEPPYDPPVPIPMPEDDLGIDGDFEPIARSPDQLRKIGDILPYFDYEPDPDVDDPCLYLCPRPDGQPCKAYAEGELIPACPDEITLGDKPYLMRAMPPSTFAWCASNVSHNPLYFEDTQLERYGHTYGDCVQPLVSLGRFSAQVITLPYQMALDPPHKEVYPLGFYRPGEPAPKLFYQVPFNAKAAVIAAGVYTGIGVVLP